jgi:thioredoxin-related protein
MPVYLFLIAMFWSPMTFAAAGDGGLEAGMVNPGFHDKPAWFKESFLDIREDIAEAADEGRRVLLYFYQDGCPYCAKLLHDNFGNAQIARKTRDNFDVVAINMWGDREVTGLAGDATSEKAFARGLRVQYTPTLLFLDEAGTVLLRVNGYLHPHRFEVGLDYVAGRREQEMAFGDYLASVDPVPAAGRLHVEPGFITAPTDLSSAREKPLLVMFEQRQCPACDELHGDILKRESVRDSLERFDVVLLDIWSKDAIVTPEGASTTVRQWASDIGVTYAPTLVFFDNVPREVFRTEAYLRAFHVEGAMDYVSSGAYLRQPEFQRYLQDRRTELEARGVDVDLWR